MRTFNRFSAVVVVWCWMMIGVSALAPTEAQAFLPGDTLDWTHPDYRLSPARGAWTSVDRLAASPDTSAGAASTRAESTWAVFSRVLGPGWDVTLHPSLHTPTWIVGPGLELGISRFHPDQAVSLANDLARRLAPALGLDPGSPAANAFRLVRAVATTNPTGQTVIGVDFVQIRDGYEVRTLNAACRLRFRFNADLGRLVALGSDFVTFPAAMTALATGNGLLDRTAAEFRAHELLPAIAPGTGFVAGFSTYVLVGVDGETGHVIGKPVHEINVRTRTPDHLWRVILDARSGDPIHRSDTLRRDSVTGSVSGGVLTGPAGVPPTAPFAVTPLRDLLVMASSGGKTLTDPHGAFQIPLPTPTPTSVMVSGALSGSWCSVQDAAGPRYDLGFMVRAVPSQPVHVVLNGTHTLERDTAQTTAYHWITEAGNWLQARVPGFNATMQNRVQVTVNLNNTCNAFYVAQTLNFFQAGGGCHNTAFPDVILHEYGHHFHWWFHGNTDPADFSEGIADQLAMYITGQREVGRNLRMDGLAVRDYRPGKPACCTRWPSTGKLPHEAGQIWAGFAMDLRDNLIAKHGAQKGIPIAEKIAVTMFVRDPSDMPAGVNEIFLQDDDDGNLKNGTPNFAEIAAAADAHGLPRVPDPLPVVIQHTPLPDTGDTANAYVVDAVITSRLAALHSATVHYRLGAGPVLGTAMKPVPNTRGLYRAVIPAQQAVQVIHYRITAQDVLNHGAVSPDQGENHFVVGRIHDVFADDFEVDRGWTSETRTPMMAGRFERVDPFLARCQAGTSQPEDDFTPAPGTLCFVTQNGPRNQDSSLHDVDWGYTEIVSPGLDLSGQTADAVRIRFAFWFTDYSVQDDALTLACSWDDGQNWKDIWSESTGAAGLERSASGRAWPVHRDHAFSFPCHGQSQQLHLRCPHRRRGRGRRRRRGGRALGPDPYASTGHHARIQPGLPADAGRRVHLHALLSARSHAAGKGRNLHAGLAHSAPLDRPAGPPRPRRLQGGRRGPSGGGRPPGLHRGVRGHPAAGLSLLQPLGPHDPVILRGGPTARRAELSTFLHEACKNERHAFSQSRKSVEKEEKKDAAFGRGTMRSCGGWRVRSASESESESGSQSLSLSQSKKARDSIAGVLPTVVLDPAALPAPPRPRFTRTRTFWTGENVERETFTCSFRLNVEGKTCIVARGT